jgi:5-bromo-4-chloroindolyl phosphate hydrolysis protein
MATTEPGSIFREQRAAKNQSLFREVNERIEPLNMALTPINRLNDFVCECAVEECTEAVRLSVDEYESVRQHPARFFVAPNDEHVWPDVERVLEKTDRYWIVEKFGHGGSMAAKLDPRSREKS